MTDIKIDTSTPGGFIRNELQEREISQKEFAVAVGISQSYLNDILSNRRKISKNFAIKTEELLGISSNVILGLQTAKEIADTKGEKSNIEIEAKDLLNEINKFICVKTFCKALNLKLKKSSEILEVIKKVLNLSNNFEALKFNVNGCYRKSAITGLDERMIATWVNIVKIIATQNKPSGQFNISDIDVLMGKVTEILHENNNTLQRLHNILDSYGIGLLRVNKVDRASIDGFSFYNDGVPYIALTCRYDRIDNLAFTILHELSHIKLGHTTKYQPQINLDVRSIDEEFEDSIEEEANKEAREWLIPSSKWKFAPPVTNNPFVIQDKYTKWAKQIKRNPWIVLGRLSYETGIYKFKSDNSRKIQGGKEVCNEIKI